jgi:D-serine deaminase-like pyridoxal phosphate-dependent protein
MRIAEIPTPAFLVDRARFRANCDAMRAKAAAAGIAFRPHVKTHKTIEGAALQLGGARGAITVSTLAEAEFYAGAGYDDITYAVPIDPGKLARAAALGRRIRLHLLVDHDEGVAALEEFAASHDVRFSVFLKVDSGARRSGVDPARAGSVALARRLKESRRLHLNGLLTHAGHSYAAGSREEIERIALEEAAVLTRFREAVGYPSLIRSVGATPTASVAPIPDADELRPGNYVFYDAFQAAIGSCSLDACAATVLATVISVYPEQNKVMLDAGALALSKDVGPVHVDPAFGYGLVCDLDLRPLPMKIFSISQEHGQVRGEEPIDVNELAVGSKLRIVPNHSCLTAALFDRYWVVENERVVEEWRPVRGW